MNCLKEHVMRSKALPFYYEFILTSRICCF